MAVMILFYINTLFLLKALIVERRHGDKARHYFLFKRKDGLDRDGLMDWMGQRDAGLVLVWQ